MVAMRCHKHRLIMAILLVAEQTASQVQDRGKRDTVRSERSGTIPPESEGTTEARDHHYNSDHYEEVAYEKVQKGHPEDHPEQTAVDDAPWRITQPGYDIRDRPHGGDMSKPVLAKLLIYADYIEHINEREGEMVVKIFMATFWTDHRMRPIEEALHGLSGFDQGELRLPGEVKESIWVPDLYLPTARRVSVPTIHQPAEYLALKANGSLKYAAFFVISFKCEMHYHNYPMDVQQCDLDIMSYKYTKKDLHLVWHPDGLVGNKRVNTKHFDVHILRPKGNSSFVQKAANGSAKDVLRIRYFMKRHLTFHLLQTYLPSVMLVFIGWLSLLVPLDFAYGRMVLSVTTLLVLVSIFVTISQITPGINEVKALDIWLFMCIFFVFSAIVDCIVDLRFLSIVEKESQIAGEEEADSDMPPIVDERLRTGQDSVHRSTDEVGDASKSYSVKFYGENTPFQADKEVLIATPAVLKWLRMAVFLERSMTVIYPALFALFTAVYWAVYITARNSHPVPENED